MPAKKKPAKKTTAKKKAARKKTATSARKTARKTPAKKTAVKKATAKKRSRPREAPPNDAMSGFTPYQPAKGEEYMNPDQEEHFRQLLRSWKQELMEEVDRTMHHMKDEAGNFPDPSDRATQESEFSLELRTRDRERKLIRKIDKALESIDQGEYGFCDTCGIEIGIRRLEARPTATQCIDCKTLDEIRERQMVH